MHEVIRPKSLQDAAYTDFEYLICWHGRDGSINYWMFYDAENSQSIKGNVINANDTDNISSIVNNIERGISLSATDLSLNEFEALMQIAENRFVYRIFTDNTSERFAPSQMSFKHRQSNGRYSIQIDLIRSDLKVWK